MKHAFIIIAHNNWNQLEQFIKTIDSDFCDFYIHVNSKVELSQQIINRLSNSTIKSEVFFTERVPIIWGDVGILNASLLALDMAVKTKKYDYYHLLTGSDLLLVSIKSMNEFFETNYKNNNSNEKLMTNYITAQIPNKKRASRVTLYNFFIPVWGNSNKYIRKIATMTNSFLGLFQSTIGINRMKLRYNELYCGSSWWSISREFAYYVVKQKSCLIEQYKNKTFAADEFAIQTLIMNSKFKDSLYTPQNDQSPNLRLLDFNRGNGYGSPHIYVYDDKKEIDNTQNIFGRKFDSRVDSKIVNYILNKIKE